MHTTAIELDQIFVDLDGYDTEIYVVVEAMIPGVLPLHLPAHAAELRSQIEGYTTEPDDPVLRQEAQRLLNYLDRLENLLSVAEAVIAGTS